MENSICFVVLWINTCLFSASFQLVGITDGYLSLLKDNGDLREDLKLPEGDLGKEIESKFESGDEFLVRVYSLCACTCV